MKVKGFQRDLFGNASFSVEATQEETSWMLNLALEYLIRAGKVTLEQVNSAEFGIDLANMEIEEMFNA